MIIICRGRAFLVSVKAVLDIAVVAWAGAKWYGDESIW